MAFSGISNIPEGTICSGCKNPCVRDFSELLSDSVATIISPIVHVVLPPSEHAVEISMFALKERGNRSSRNNIFFIADLVFNSEEIILR